ncbi:hypothetical protein OYT13_23795 [Pandoraea sp. XJJ-1]|uniref:hypothetical protein n=1 Tax=Pandoraea sp. XJJ-1 TaxID=3002643 RepID=UPI002281411A|nr:hypothetical protein [Pandoraea sp. XJJ-1]WAL82729.1 hypothetical protein OYT13_23795 [Pandoraea sp. XJJ-1]
MQRMVGGGRAVLWGLHVVVGLVAVGIYGGNAVDFFFFTLSAALMLDIGIFKSRSYGTGVLALFVWLGIWLKISCHFIVGYPYIEPLGKFKFLPAQFSELLHVSTIGMMGFAIAFLVASRFYVPMRENTVRPRAKPWLPSALKWAWLLSFLAILGLGVINADLNILRVGLPPDVILPYPGNALVSWLMSTGFALGVATLMYLSVLSRSNVKLGIVIVILEGFIVGVSILSRASYVFHLLPVCLVLAYMHFSGRRLFGHRAALAFVAVAAVGAFVTATAVNLQREFAYTSHPEIARASMGDGRGSGGNPAAAAIIAEMKSHGFLLRAAVTFSQLAVDRWVGAEGVMAAVAYDDKSLKTFGRLMMEQRQLNTISEYQSISAAHYKDMDPKQFQFATLPGPIGFFYLSGAIWIVFAGCFLMGLAVLTTERLAGWMTENSFIMAFMGVYTASLASQFGLTPRQNVIPLVMNFAALALLATLQSLVSNAGCVARWRDRLTKRRAVLPS